MVRISLCVTRSICDEIKIMVCIFNNSIKKRSFPRQTKKLSMSYPLFKSGSSIDINFTDLFKDFGKDSLHRLYSHPYKTFV